MAVVSNNACFGNTPWEERVTDRTIQPMGILFSIGCCWVLGFVIVIVLAACMSDVESVLGTGFGQPIAQIYYDALGKK